MKKLIKLVALAGTVAGAVAGAAYAVKKKKQPKRVEDGFEYEADIYEKCKGLKDLNGNPVYMEQFKGKRVCILFWGTWNLTSRKELIELEKLYRETAGGDIEVIAVNIGDEVEKVKQFIEANDYSFRVLIDSDEKAMKALGVTLVPTYFFANTEGKLVSKLFDSLTTEEIEEELEKLY